MTVTISENMVLRDVSIFSHNELGELNCRMKNVSLTMAAGEWLNVVGVNGSGKSTLAKLLAGIHPDGIAGDLQRGFAGESCSPIVLQQPRTQLFGETPREEVVFALEWKGIKPELVNGAVDQALSRASLSALADEPWEGLSGGQQQLAAIAASTACEIPLIVMDEVTSMLDEANRNTVMQQVRALHRNGTAVVWVTQRLDELEPNSRVAALGEGQVIYDGNVRDFLYGAEGQPSACERCGLRLPYLAAMAIELRRLGKLKDPLPVTAEQWRKVLGRVELEEAKHTGQ